MNRAALRQHIARAIGDRQLGTVTAMNGQNVRSNDLLQFPNDHWNDGECFVYSGTGAGKSAIISDFAATLGEITPFVAWGTAPVAGDLFELHKYQGWMTDDYNKAIDLAMIGAEDVYLADKIDETLTMQYGRYEYPIPTGFRYLSGVYQDVLMDASDYWGSNFYDGDEALFSVTGNQKLAQAFKPNAGSGSQGLWVGSVRLLLRMIGSYGTARTMTLRIETNNAGVPSATLVTNATKGLSTAGVVGRQDYFDFAFASPVFLTGDTTYHLVLSVDGAADASNYVSWGRDDDTTYGNGAAAKYNGTAWSTIANAALVFALGNPMMTARWEAFPADKWAVIRSDKLLWVGDPNEARALRLVGQGQATALTADTDTVGVPEEYLVTKAAAILLAERAGGPQTDADARLQRATYYEALAAKMLGKMRTAARPNSRVVDAR